MEVWLVNIEVPQGWLALNLIHLTNKRIDANMSMQIDLEVGLKNQDLIRSSLG